MPQPQRVQIAVAILNNDRPVISGFENAGLIVHIMDSVEQGHYYCIYCTTELIRSRGNTGTGVPSPEPWYYMHPRNGPNDCGNTANYRVFSIITGSLRMTEPGRGLKIREESPWFGRALSWNSDTHQLVGRSNWPEEFRHPSTCRSEQLARTSALETARRSETELIESIVASA
jgi:hypothetical protein